MDSDIFDCHIQWPSRLAISRLRFKFHVSILCFSSIAGPAVPGQSIPGPGFAASLVPASTGPADSSVDLAFVLGSNCILHQNLGLGVISSGPYLNNLVRLLISAVIDHIPAHLLSILINDLPQLGRLACMRFRHNSCFRAPHPSSLYR